MNRSDEKVIRERSVVDANGCWLWSGALNPKGYGRLGGGLAHRRAFVALRGPIPEGLHIDHLCRVRHCVNPDHMEPVTPRENVRRGISFAVTNRAKTHCAHGHEFSPENTYIRPDGFRDCRACGRDRARRHYGRTKAA